MKGIKNSKSGMYNLVILVFIISVFSLNLFSVKYESGIGVFNVDILSIEENSKGKYVVEFQVENLVKQNSQFSAEVFYTKKSLFLGSKQFRCNDICTYKIELKKTIFDKHELVVVGKFGKQFYKIEKKFNIKYQPKVEYDIVTSNYYFIQEDKVEITGQVISSLEKETRYTFELYSNSDPENRIYFDRICLGDCNFILELNHSIILDDYYLNVYNEQGEIQRKFKILYSKDLADTENILKKKIQVKNEYKKIRKVKNNFELRELEEIKSKKVKHKLVNPISEVISIEFQNLSNESINFFSLGIEKLEINNSIQSYAIDPEQINFSIAKVTSVARGQKLYKCELWNFTTQTCYGDWKFLQNVVPGQVYSFYINQTDPAFAEFRDESGFIENNMSVYKNNLFNVTVNVSCSGSDCNNTPIELIYNDSYVGEAGNVTLSNFNSVLIPFKKKYNSIPIIIATPVTDTNSDDNSLIPVINSINTTHVNISLCEDAGATTCSSVVESEQVHYMIFDVDMISNLPWIDVGTVTGTTNGGNTALSFSKTFTNTPYIFAQVQSRNGLDSGSIAPTIWAHTITTTGAQLIGCEHPGIADACGTGYSETLGYVAIDPTLVNIKNLTIGTQSISNSAWTTISYGQTYSNSRIAVLQNSDAGGQDPQYPWANLVNSTNADIRYCEQDAAGVCNSHTAETVVWFAVEDGFMESLEYVPVSTTVSETPFYSVSNNPQNVNVSVGETKLITFTLNATGNFDTSHILSVTTNGSKSNSTLNVTILRPPGPIPAIDLIIPNQTNNDLYQGLTLDIQFNVSCTDADCENLSLSLFYKKEESIGESGNVSFENFNSKLIKFENTYSKVPIIFAVPVTDTNSDDNSLIPVINSINTTHANISLCEDAGATTCSSVVESEQVHYMVFDVDKTNNLSWIEVGRINATTNGGNTPITFTKTFASTPYVYGQSQTYNIGPSNIAAHSWFHTVTTTTAQLIGCDHSGTGDVCAGTGTEEFGYLAIDVNNHDFNKYDYGTQSIADSTWTAVTYGQTYNDPRLLVCQNSDAGAQDPQYPWARLITTTGAEVRYCEQDAAGVCNTHANEDVRWFVVEDGEIKINTKVDALVSNNVSELPFYVLENNPDNFTVIKDEYKIINYTLYPNGNYNSTFELFGYIDQYTISNSFNVTILESKLDINLTSPNVTLNIIQNETFTLNGSLTCEGYCGNVSVYAMFDSNVSHQGSPSLLQQYSENVSNSSSGIPFWTSSIQPQQCVPGIDGNCSFQWEINVSGDIDSSHLIGILFNSTSLGEYYTNFTQIDIIGGPSIKYLNESLVFTKALASYESESIDATVEVLLFNQTNIQIGCDSGDCAIFSHNFVNGDDLSIGNHLIEFTCFASTVGNYSALFSINSTQDISEDLINLSCNVGELELYLVMEEPDPLSITRYDATQNETFNITFNVTCNDILNCSNTEINLVYQRDSIGETGSVLLSNFNSNDITFTQTYEKVPIVIATPATQNVDDSPFVPVINSISTTGMSISLCRDNGLSTCDTSAAEEEVHYFIFDVDKVQNYSWIQTGKINVTTNGNANAFSFGSSFTNTPYIFTQSQTYNIGGGNIAGHAWITSPTTIGANIVGCDHPGTGDVCAGTGTEEFAYVAIDPILVNISNINIGTQSISASAWTAVSFTNTLTSPRVMVTQNSESGSQDPQYAWARAITSSGADVRYCEADGANYCDSHNAEDVRWFSVEDGPMYIGSIANSRVSNISGQTPFYVIGPNPQLINLTNNETKEVTFEVNATGTIHYTDYLFGILNNGVDSKLLYTRIIGLNYVQFEDSSLTFPTVYQDEKPESLPTSIYAKYANNNVIVSCISGNCSEFLHSFVNGSSLSEDQSVGLSFLCKDENAGNFTAIFNVTSNEDSMGDSINLSCVVEQKQLDIDLIMPDVGQVYEAELNKTFDLKFNVTCNKIGGCTNVDVFALFEDDTLNWWNLSWPYKKEINVTPQLNSSSYQLYLELNSSIMGSNFDWFKSCNDLRFIRNNSIQLDYYIENCDSVSQKAKIWVETDLNLTVGSNYSFDIYYGNLNVNTTSDGNNTFPLFEDFESYTSTGDGVTPPTWSVYSSGNGYLETDIDGNRVINKTTNDDPHGAQKTISKTMDSFEARFLSKRVNQQSGTQNRYSVGNSSAHGYGGRITDFTGTPQIYGIEERTAGSGVDLQTGSISLQTGTWYKYILNYYNQTINFSILDVNDNLLEWVQTTDPTVTSFDTFYIHGGREFYTDDIIVREYVTNEPIISYGVEESRYVSIPSIISEPFYVQEVNPQIFNISQNATLTVNFTVNATGNIGQYYNIKGLLDNGDSSEILQVEVIPSFWINLRLQKFLNSSFNQHMIELKLFNLYEYATPRGRNLLVYCFIPENITLQTPFDFEDSSRYETSYRNLNIFSSGMNGTLYEWTLSNLTKGGIFEKYNQTSNENNSWFVKFNISVAGPYSIGDIRYGFDPILNKK